MKLSKIYNATNNTGSNWDQYYRYKKRSLPPLSVLRGHDCPKKICTKTKVSMYSNHLNVNINVINYNEKFYRNNTILKFRIIRKSDGLALSQYFTKSVNINHVDGEVIAQVVYETEDGLIEICEEIILVPRGV